MRTQWKLKEYDKTAAQNLMQALSVSELMGRLLVLRGITDPEEARKFLYQTDIKTMASPMELSGMKELVERVHTAVRNQEKIVVYGDYDVDGICSVVILMECLQHLGAQADYRIPDRFSEGYGLNCQAIEEIAAQGYRLIITVDCGITSIEEAVFCREKGIDLIITDHHNPGNELPDACVIVNPKLDVSETSRNLAGAGVAFKTALALAGQNIPTELFQEWVILASLATVADVVPLLGENRILLKNGLPLMGKTQRPGLKKLFQMEGLLEQRITTEKLAFQIIPKLNSAGRLETASISIQTLLTRDMQEAEYLADYLVKLNEQRRQLEDEMLQQAIRTIEEEPEVLLKPLLIVQGADWNHGIVGILASRLVAKYHKPTLVISWSEGIGKGSGRSVEEISLYDMLSAGRAHLLRFGGHKMAAGLTVKEENFQAFYDAAMQKAEEIMLQMPEGRIFHVDAQITSQQLLSEGAVLLEQLEPMGEGNPQPLFLMRGVDADFYKRIGKKQEHVLCRVGKMEGVAFQQASRVEREQMICQQDMIFGLSEHEYMGIKRLQMMIREFQSSVHYHEKCGGKPSGLLRKVQSISRRLVQNKPVVLVYDDVRCLQKHSTMLKFYFKTSCLYAMHGEMTFRERMFSEYALARGEGRIFTVTWTALKQWLKKNTFPLRLEEIYFCWNRPRMDKMVIPIPERIQQHIWEEDLYETEIPAADELDNAADRHLIYLNRVSTVQKVTGNFPQHISEVQQDMRDRVLLRRYWEESGGIFLTDGVPLENEMEAPLQPGTMELADVPYTWGEIALWMQQELKQKGKMTCTFSGQDIQCARELLEKIYPEEEKMFSAVKKCILQNLEINKPCRISLGDLQKLYQDQTDESISRMELEGILRIFCDLGLCDYRKNGTIFTIKLLSNSYTVKKEDSLYFLEGCESRKSLEYCLEKIAESVE